MRSSFLPLALLFIAFTNPSIAQKEAAEEAGGGAGAEVQEVVVFAGEPLAVPCSLRVEQLVEWRADGAAPAGDMRAAPERPAPRGVGLQARLLAAHAHARHAGLYTCTRGGRSVRVRVLPAPALAPAPAGDALTTAAPATPDAPTRDDDELRAVVRFKLYQPLTFNCTLSVRTADNINYQWIKNGTLMEGLGSNSKVKLEQQGSVLTIKRALEDDYGNYSCTIDSKPGRAWEARAHSLARVASDTNVVEGQKFSITCKLYGKPYERVRWTYALSREDNATELALEGRFSAKDSPAGVPGGVLEVTDAKRDDAGIYTCEPVDGESASSVLRVKDVYAALWPFLGICLEVFILCAIILVYEKRRTKPEMEDSDADHDQ